MIRKCLAIGIILLFVGVTIAPTINFQVVKASTDDDRVEVTTELCGFPGIKPHTMTISKHQLNEIETSLRMLKSSFLQSEILNEKVGVFNQIIDVFSRCGLLGNVNIGYLKMYFNQSIRIQEQIVKSIHNTNKISSKSEDTIFENICCLVFSKAGDEIVYLSSPMRTYFSYLIQNKINYSSAPEIFKYIGLVLWLPSFFLKYLFIPLHFAFNSWTIIEGWGSHVDSNGLYGVKTQSLQGTCIDLLGFFGIKIQYNPVPASFISFYDGYLIGFAVTISKTKGLYFPF
jgi:hypothetical protein